MTTDPSARPTRAARGVHERRADLMTVTAGAALGTLLGLALAGGLAALYWRWLNRDQPEWP
jgi:hypothetical protein